MRMNDAWSVLVNTELKHRIRLSMHPSVNNGNKYSFQLIPSENAHHSAWHSAVLVDGDQVSTLHKKDALAAGHELMMREGRPYYFQAKER